MLLIIDCKKKITWKKLDHINGSVLSSDGKIASEEKELLKVAENGEVDKVMDEVVDELLVSINKLAMITSTELSAFLSHLLLASSIQWSLPNSFDLSWYCNSLSNLAECNTVSL